MFLDEIYAPNLNEFRNKTRQEIFSQVKHLHFGISAVIVAGSHLYELYSKSSRIKNRYFSTQPDLIFHYVDILNTRGEYQSLSRDVVKHKAFTTSLESFVANSHFKYLSAFVDKHELIKSYGTFNTSGKAVNIKKIGSNLFPKSPFIDYNLYLLCLRKILAEFYTYISDRRHVARGIVVAEARGEREDTELRKAFQKIYNNGIASISPKEFRGKILDLYIVPKSQNYIGTQLADLVLYPTYDSQVPNHSPRTDHLVRFETALKRKLLKNVFVLP